MTQREQHPKPASSALNELLALDTMQVYRLMLRELADFLALPPSAQIEQADAFKRELRLLITLAEDADFGVKKNHPQPDSLPTTKPVREKSQDFTITDRCAESVPSSASLPQQPQELGKGQVFTPSSASNTTARAESPLPPPTTEKRSEEKAQPTAVSVQSPEQPASENASGTTRQGVPTRAETFVKPVVRKEALTNVPGKESTILASSLPSLAKALTINDQRLFTRELCGGDKQRFTELIVALDNCDSLADSLTLLQKQCPADSPNEAIEQLVALLERRFANE